MDPLDASADKALRDLLAALAERDYAFVTPAPLAHARAIAGRPEQTASTLEDVFGWNLPFARDAIEPAVFDLLQAGEALEPRGALLISKYRVARCVDRLFLHSQFPTLAVNAVFFGPDSYRFATYLSDALHGAAAGLRIADIGTGSGVGALAAQACCPNAALILTDINPQALRLARINATAASAPVTLVLTSALDNVAGVFDVIIANPPYLADPAHRTYRDGGGEQGARVSLDWTHAALPRLAPGGRFLLYTGSAIVAGADRLHGALATLAQTHHCALHYEEVDPDVWREELQRADYAGVDRIAVVTAAFTRLS